MNKQQQRKKAARRRERDEKRAQVRKIERIKHRAKIISLASVLAFGSSVVDGHPIAAEKPSQEGKPLGIESPPVQGIGLEKLLEIREEGLAYAAAREAERLQNLARIHESWNQIKAEKEAREAARIKAEQEAKAREEAAAKAAAEKEAAIQAEQARQAQADSARSSRGDVQGHSTAYTMTMRVTAYTAGYESTGKRPGDYGYGITASGAYVQAGRTVAAGPGVPFGSRVVIPSLGIDAIVEDRGGAIKDNCIDVYMESEAAARAFGVKNVDVTIYPAK